MPQREDRQAPARLARAAEQGDAEREVGRDAEHGAEADIAGLLHADRARDEESDRDDRVDHGLERQDRHDGEVEPEQMQAEPRRAAGGEPAAEVDGNAGGDPAAIGIQALSLLPEQGRLSSAIAEQVVGQPADEGAYATALRQPDREQGQGGGEAEADGQHEIVTGSDDEKRRDAEQGEQELRDDLCRHVDDGAGCRDGPGRSAQGDGADAEDVTADGGERQAGGGCVADHAAPDEPRGIDVRLDRRPGRAEHAEQGALKREQQRRAGPADRQHRAQDIAGVEAQDQEGGDRDAEEGQQDRETAHHARHYTDWVGLGYRAQVQHDQTPPSPHTLVTGATGFVGSAVARTLLARGHRLKLLVRRGSDRRNVEGLAAELVEGDLRDSSSFAAAVAGCRYVMHVAADYRLWVPDPGPMMQANIDGTRALLLAARDAGVERIVYCSSVAALGLIGDGTPGTEDTVVDPAKVIGVYKQSKYLAEQEVRRLVREEGVPAVIVNPSTPIGPRDIKPTPTGRMVLDGAAGRMPAFVDTGLNVVHVDDVAEGHALALERGRIGEAYILGGTDMRLEQILAVIDDVMERKPQKRVRLPHKALVPLALGMEGAARVFGIEPMVTREMLAMAKKQMFFSSAKAENELGYAPRPPRQALADAIAWFRAEGRLKK